MDTKYRMLKSGEILIEGDEYRSDNGWKPYNYSNGVSMVMPVGAPIRPAGYYRRPLPASLLPEGIPPLPAGWLFYGKGPLLHEAGDKDELLAIYPENKGWKQGWWAGDSSDASYAIRAGTELARLNGLEPMMLVSNRPEGMPAELPDPPTPPANNRWMYRGTGWTSRNPCYYAAHIPYPHNNSWSDGWGTGGSTNDCHYLEAVPIKPASQVWIFSSEDPVLPLSSAQSVRIEELEQKIILQQERLNFHATRAGKLEDKVTELEACLEKTEKWSDTYAAERDGYIARAAELEQQLDRIRDLAIQRSR